MGAVLCVAACESSGRCAPPAAARSRVRGAAPARAPHGHDTLAFFKLRRDDHYLFSATAARSRLPDRERRAAALRRSGRPRRRAAGAARESCALRRGARPGLGALGASAGLLGVYRDAGLRALYLGDEAIVETPRSALEGRAIRKVRQSVTGSQTAGLHRRRSSARRRWTPRRSPSSSASRARWRDGAPERGFSMAMDGSRGPARATRSSSSRATTTARSAASSTSCRRTAGRPCRCRHAPRPRHAERADGVPGRQRDRAAARARRRGGLAQLRRLRALSATPARPRSSGSLGRRVRSATRTSRSRASTASTRSSTRAGSRATCVRAAARPAAGRPRRPMRVEGQLRKPALRP